MLLFQSTNNFIFLHGTTANSGPDPHYRGFTITLTHTTVDRTPLDEWSAGRGNLYLTKTLHPQQTDMHAPCGIGTLSPSERLQTHALDRAASGIGSRIIDHEMILLVTPRNYLINELILTPSHDRFPATFGPDHHSQTLDNSILQPLDFVPSSKCKGKNHFQRRETNPCCANPEIFWQSQNSRLGLARIHSR
jgi:hypothetical protein